MPDLRSKLHQSWGWLLALGLFLILFGGLILTTPLGVVTASLTTEIWIAAALVAAGVLQLMHGMRSGDWSHASWQMLGGVISIIGGVLIFVYPTFGLVSLTMIIAITLVAQGITSLMVSGGVADWGGPLADPVGGHLDRRRVADPIRPAIVGRLDPRHHRRRRAIPAGLQPDAAGFRRAPRHSLTASRGLRQPHRVPTALRILDRMAQNVEAILGQ
jgi:hypothetical protein